MPWVECEKCEGCGGWPEEDFIRRCPVCKGARQVYEEFEHIGKACERVLANLERAQLWAERKGK